MPHPVDDAKAMGKPKETDNKDGRRNYTVRAILVAAAESERAMAESALGDDACTPETIAAVGDVARRHSVPQKLRGDVALRGAAVCRTCQLAVPLAGRGAHAL